MMGNKTLVCLPTLNEEQSIANMVSGITALGYDLVVCDAGSTDQTVAIAKAAGVPVIFRDAPGKGAGVQRALRYADEKGFAYILFLDCDETYPVYDIPKLLAYAPPYQMVIGARNLGQVAFVNAWGNRAFNFLINVLFGGKLKDINSGMRLMEVKAYRPLITANGFDVEVQISCVTLKHKLRHLEIPIDYAERKGQSKVSFADGIPMLLRIFRERFS